VWHSPAYRYSPLHRRIDGKERLIPGKVGRDKMAGEGREMSGTKMERDAPLGISNVDMSIQWS